VNHYRLWLVTLLIFTGQNANSQGIPFRWGQEMPILRSELFRLEVSYDKEFSDIALNQLVRGGPYSWTAPREGVFFWRLTRVDPETMDQGSPDLSKKEGSTPPEGSSSEPTQSAPERIEKSVVASGIFIGILSSPSRPIKSQDPSPTNMMGKDDGHVTLSWDPWPNSDGYQITSTKPDGRRSRMISMQTRIRMARPTNEPWVQVSIEPRLLDRELFSGFRIWSQVQMSPDPKEATHSNLPQVHSVVPPLPASKTPSTSIEQPAPEATPTYLGLGGLSVFSLQRQYRWSKLDVTIESTTQDFAIGATLRQELPFGLWLDAYGNYVDGQHNSQFLTTTGAFRSLQGKDSNFSFHGGLGWNLFFPSSWDHLAFGPRLVGDYRQYTRLPFELNQFATEAVKPAHQAGSYWGLGLFARIAFGDWKWILLGDLMQGEEADQEVVTAQTLLSFQTSKRLELGLGYLFEHLYSQECHATRLLCLAEGQVTTELFQQGPQLMLGYSL
jgi:hypothetical protein